LGNIKNEDDYNNLSYDYRFDLDSYKILAKFLSKPPKNLSITPFKIFETSSN
jgi:hypothetical protein